MAHNYQKLSFARLGFLVLLVTGFGFKATAQYNFYYGNLHSHSSYSDGNQDSATSGLTRPGQDYVFADASQHMDFLGISEHNHVQAGLHKHNFPKGFAQADSATTPTFVALYGMEWGIIANGGHMLVYGVNELLGWDAGNYDVFVGQHDYTQLFREINKRPGAFAMFAHPQSGDYNYLNTDTTAFQPSADSALVGSPMRSGPASSTSIDYDDAPTTSFESTFNRMIAKGYHIGITLDHDNHKTTFGRTSKGRLVALAPELTRPALMQAFRARRFYASDDWNAKVTMALNDQPMGSIVAGRGRVNLTVNVADDDLEAVRSITLLRGVPGSRVNATTIATAPAGSATLTYTDSVAANASYHYHAIILQADGDRIVTSPIWFKQSNTVGIEPIASKPLLNVFPNPAAQGMPVNLSYFSGHFGSVFISVLDGLGREVAQFATSAMQEPGSNGVMLDTKSLSPGVYTVRMQQGNQQVHSKLVVR